MINGKYTLKNMYPDLDESQYQPNGVDLTLDKVMVFKSDYDSSYGMFLGTKSHIKEIKVLPQQEELKKDTIHLHGEVKSVYKLEPNTPYIGVTKEKIQISRNSGQIYLPRSSLLRAGVDLRSAWGDAGFNGHLSFLLINHNDKPFYLESGVRFAQLVDIQAENSDVYNGDYQE